MKHDVLRSVAHNISASLASGIGLLIGVYDFQVFQEVRRSPQGYISVDFLNGTTSGARPSPKLAKAVQLYRDALPELCKKQGVSVSDFATLVTRFSSTTPNDAHFSVTVEDNFGCSTCTEYQGYGGSRMRIVDQQGRVRAFPVKRFASAVRRLDNPRK